MGTEAADDAGVPLLRFSKVARLVDRSNEWSDVLNRVSHGKPAPRGSTRRTSMVRAVVEDEPDAPVAETRSSAPATLIRVILSRGSST
jgi:hypothetical protein